jgi:hypothetical protein
LPANAIARLADETPDESVRAVTWIALTDALDAFSDAYDDLGPIYQGPMNPLVQLARRLGIVTVAVHETLQVFPDDSATTSLLEALEALRRSRDWAVKAVRGASVLAHDGSLAEAELRRQHAALPIPAALPSLEDTDEFPGR